LDRGSGRSAAVAKAGARPGAAAARARRDVPARSPGGAPGSRRRQSHRGDAAVRAGRHAGGAAHRPLLEAHRMSGATNGPDGTFSIRAPREDDVDAVVDVMNAASVDDIGVEDTEPADVFRWWHRDDFDLSRDAWLAEAADGRVIGSAAIAF